MDKPIEVHELALVQVFRAVMEEEYRRHRDALQDLPEELAGSFARRLAAICNHVSEGLLKNTTCQLSSYRERGPAPATPLTLRAELKEEINSVKQAESRAIQSRLGKALEAASTRATASSSAFLRALRDPQGAPLPPPADTPFPDIRSALETSCRELLFEREMKDRALLNLAALRSAQDCEVRPAQEWEERVLEKVFWSP